MLLSSLLRHGEVSRAMRNRGVEVFLPPPAPAAEEAPQPQEDCEPAARPDPHLSEALPLLSDLQLLVSARGVPGRALPAAMAAAHWRAAASPPTAGHRPTLRAPLRCASLAAHLVRSGWPVLEALDAAWIQVCQLEKLLMQSKSCMRALL